MTLLESLQAQGILLTVEPDQDGERALTIRTGSTSLPKELHDLISSNRSLLVDQLIDQISFPKTRLS